MTDFYLRERRYRINEVEHIATPRLVVFQDAVEENITRMRRYLEAVTGDNGFDHLCVHVKTNKSSFQTKMLLDQGISCYKSTLNEVSMLIDSGVKDIFIAYPLLEQGAAFIARNMKEHPEINFQVQIGCREHAEILKKIAQDYTIQWKYYIDIDVGMHRTGIKPEKVFSLYKSLADLPEFTFTGLHGYDGHIHFKDENKRKTETGKSMQQLIEVYEIFSQHQVPVERVMAAGSLTFEQDLQILYEHIPDSIRVMVSPGTWIYWDTEYDAVLKEKFELAALVLAQVIEAKSKNRLTLNCGHKRWGADRGPVELFSEQGVKVLSFNEEHTVLESRRPHKSKVGDYILIAPKHVCSTVNLYEYFTLIGKDGEIRELHSPVDARNR